MAKMNLFGEEFRNKKVDSGYSEGAFAPIYTPREGVFPEVGELYDARRYYELLRNINRHTELSEDVKTFLTLAAARHVVLDFSKIADYYATADKEVQELMEDSALVIVDLDKAIEKGFVTLSQRILEIARGVGNARFPKGSTVEDIDVDYYKREMGVTIDE